MINAEDIGRLFGGLPPPVTRVGMGVCVLRGFQKVSGGYQVAPEMNKVSGTRSSGYNSLRPEKFFITIPGRSITAYRIAHGERARMDDDRVGL
jgi:hypothetical protein